MNYLAVALALSLASVCSSAATAAPERLNFLLIVAEDLSPRIGAFGDPLARTPRIDRLAREGVRFTRAFTAAPVCAPSRAALITGMYPQSIGAQHMRTGRARDGSFWKRNFRYLTVPPLEVKAFPELLRRAGYFTANHYKTDYQFGEPFTIWDVNDPEESAWIHWRAAPEGQPFFAMINLQITHESYLWPVDLPTDDRTVAAVLARNARAQVGHPALTGPLAVIVPPYLADTPATRRDIARQYDNAAILDSQVGAILDALAADGLLNKTIVIFTTDHGDGLPHAKRRPYDAGLHVPMIVRLPNSQGAGTVRADLVSFVDLAPTILSLAGSEVPTFIQGQSFLGAHRSPERRYVFASADRMDVVPGQWRSARDARFQYLVNRMPERPLFEHIKFRDIMPSMQDLWRLHAQGKLTPLQESQFTAPRAAEELYDLVADPDQTRNLAADPTYSSDLTRLRTALAEFEASTPDLSLESERVMAERMWPGSKQPVTESPVATRAAIEGGVAIELMSPTAGASIGYRSSDDPPGRWRLYLGPVHLRTGAKIEAKAVRYGYAESAGVEVVGSPVGGAGSTPQ